MFILSQVRGREQEESGGLRKWFPNWEFSMDSRGIGKGVAGGASVRQPRLASAERTRTWGTGP